MEVEQFISNEEIKGHNSFEFSNSKISENCDSIRIFIDDIVF